MTIETILPTPDLFAAKRILCVQPHYDDNDIGAAGILSQLAEKGADLTYLTVTNDLMGVIHSTLSAEAAAEALKRDQFAAAQLVGVKEHVWLGYPDAGEYNYFALRRDLLAHFRRIRPDFIFAPDPWLTYEGHRDHIQAGLAAAEAVILCGLTRIASSDPAIDASYQGHDIQGIAFYFTREPNVIVDITSTWQTKQAVLRCYETQFDSAGLDQLVMAMEIKTRQVAQGKPYQFGEALKVLHTSALHCGI